MPTDLNFEAAPLLNEAAFGETSEESEVVRDRRGGSFAVPVGRRDLRVRFAPGFGGAGPMFRRQPFFQRPNVAGRPAFFGAPAFRRGPAFAGQPFFGGGGFSGVRPVFRGGPFFGGGLSGFGRGGFTGPGGFRGGLFSGRPFPGGQGFRGGFGFRRRFGRFGFLGDSGGITPSTQLSELVSWAQSCLAQMGAENVPQNGILGPRTRRAISDFQTQQQLAATGVLDNQTIEALQAACSAQAGGDQDGSGGQAGSGGQ